MCAGDAFQAASRRREARRVTKRGGWCWSRRESWRDFLGRDFLPPAATRRFASGIFDGAAHRQESFQALRLRGEPRELLEAPDDDVERPLHGSKRVPGTYHPEFDLAGEEPGRDDETG